MKTPRDGTRCDGITQRARFCKRKAQYSWALSNGTTAHYCGQHRNGAGAMKMLLPYPWEVLSEVKLGHDREVGRALRGGRR